MRSWPAALIWLTGCFALVPPDAAPRGTPDAAYSTMLRLYAGYALRCSAVLIAPRVALSAAHCFREPASDWSVIRDSGIRVRVVAVAQRSDTDVSELALGSTLSPPYAQIATRLPREAWISGYGCALHADGSRSLSARAVAVHALSDSLLVLDGRACAGDSGGGIFDARGALLGITSARSTSGGAQVWATPAGG